MNRIYILLEREIKIQLTRLKFKTKIHSPVLDAPTKGDQLYVATMSVGPVLIFWEDIGRHRAWLKAGVLHKTRESAHIQSKSLISSFDEVKEEIKSISSEWRENE